MYKGKGKS